MRWDNIAVHAIISHQDIRAIFNLTMSSLRAFLELIHEETQIEVVATQEYYLTGQQLSDGKAVKISNINPTPITHFSESVRNRFMI